MVPSRYDPRLLTRPYSESTILLVLPINLMKIRSNFLSVLAFFLNLTPNIASRYFHLSLYSPPWSFVMVFKLLAFQPLGSMVRILVLLWLMTYTFLGSNEEFCGVSTQLWISGVNPPTKYSGVMVILLVLLCLLMNFLLPTYQLRTI